MMKVQYFEVYAFMRCLYDDNEEIPGTLEVDYKHIIDKINKDEYGFEEQFVCGMEKDERHIFIPRSDVKYFIENISRLRELQRCCYKMNDNATLGEQTECKKLEKSVDKMIDEWID